jgi:hypothetical protein
MWYSLFGGDHLPCFRPLDSLFRDDRPAAHNVCGQGPLSKLQGAIFAAGRATASL